MASLGLADASCELRLLLDDHLLTFTVSEFLEGSDLNADGDTADFVLHVHDVRSGKITNLGLDTVISSGFMCDFPELYFQLDGSLVAFAVSERGQGNRDLNADGDTEDFVLHVHDARTGVTSNLGLALSNIGDSKRTGLVFWLSGDLVALAVSEMAHGESDLNTDGDAEDLALHVHDTRSGITTNLGLAVPWTDCCPRLLSPQIYPQVDGDLVAFVVPEAHQGGMDLNGDGDASDGVLHVYDARVRVTTNVGLANGAGSWFTSTNFQFDGNWLAFTVPEENEDLNRDGDTEDWILHVADLTRVETPPFARGDTNTDNTIDIADAIFTLSYLFAQGPTPTCMDAADANDDGAVHISDGIYILQNLFANGPAIPPPYPDCGVDPTVDGLGCVEYPPCE